MDCIPKQIKVLLVEDNPGDSLIIQEQLKQTDAIEFNLSHGSDLSSAIVIMEQKYFDIILLDLVLPDGQGIELFLKIQEANPHIPIILLTGMDDNELASEVVHQGAQDYLIKGQTSGELLKRAISYGIERNVNKTKKSLKNIS